MKVLCSIILATALLSCQKDEPVQTHVRGVIKTYGTEKGLPGLRLRVYREAIGGGGVFFGGGSSGSSAEIMELVTDAQGRYSGSFEATRNDGNYYIAPETAPDHFGPIRATQIWPGEDNVVNIFQAPYAYLKLHVKNVNPYNTDDWIGCTFSSGGSFSFPGHGINSTSIRTIAGNMDIYLYISYRKNNQYTDFIDTVFAAAGDTTFHQIFY
jgi:hypothetical protein